MAKKEEKGNILERLVPILLIASVGLAFVVGVLWQKVSSLESGEVGSANAEVTPTVAGAQPQRPASGKLSEEQAGKVPGVTDEDHIRGSRDAKVLLIEYSDFECPFCTKFHETAQQVVNEYGGQVAWIYRHFPLDQLHKNARPAAEASECAAELGGEEAFWAFTDAIYKDQSRASDLSSVASSTGLNLNAFQSCLESGRYADKVENQYQGGLAVGVRGTPGNVILNEKGEAWLIPGALPLESLKEAIDEALGS